MKHIVVHIWPLVCAGLQWAVLLLALPVAYVAAGVLLYALYLRECRP
jgi:hypothetical protein